MSFGIKILIGFIVGLIFAFFTILSSIKKKYLELETSWNVLSEALNIRYLKLNNILHFLKKHMNEATGDIDELILLCTNATKADGSISNIKNRLVSENNINYKLEDIKSRMENYPSLAEDAEIQSAIDAIVQSEASVGEAISVYNKSNLEYRVFLEVFPISLCANIVGIKPEFIPFNVADIKEFDDNYVFEDEI